MTTSTPASTTQGPSAGRNSSSVAGAPAVPSEEGQAPASSAPNNNNDSEDPPVVPPDLEAPLSIAMALLPSLVSSAVACKENDEMECPPNNNDTDSTSRSPAESMHPVRLEDWAKFVKQLEGDEFQNVSLAQIERIKVVHDRFLEDATLSFNYNTLILVASVIAALGLVSNSVAVIIASMLVSPLMGPVAGMAYGSTIRDWNLVRISVINECGSLIFCILVGAVVGACCGPTALAETWPTPEMASRGTLTNFVVGLPIAFFSGLGVAVALLDEQFSSLVGVAISASLLPPAVNAGIMWVAYAFYSDNHPVPSDDPSYYDANDFRVGGVISLSLTLANIVLIWIAGMIIFRLKEVLPLRKKRFWSDLGVARKIFQKQALAGSADRLKVTASEADTYYKQARVMRRSNSSDDD